MATSHWKHKSGKAAAAITASQAALPPESRTLMEDMQAFTTSQWTAPAARNFQQAQPDPSAHIIAAVLAAVPTLTPEERTIIEHAHAKLHFGSSAMTIDSKRCQRAIFDEAGKLILDAQGQAQLLPYGDKLAISLVDRSKHHQPTESEMQLRRSAFSKLHTVLGNSAVLIDKAEISEGTDRSVTLTAPIEAFQVLFDRALSPRATAIRSERDATKNKGAQLQ